MNEAIAESLIREMDTMPVIDAHEHLPAEEDAVKQKADVFTRIFCHYSVTSAVTAGLTGDRLALKNTEIPLEERWERFKPWLDAMRDTGYARAARIAARDLCGIEEIDEQSYRLLSERLQEQNTQGFYDRILKEKCRIETVLNQGSWDDGRTGYAKPVNRGFMALGAATAESLGAFHQAWLKRNPSGFEDAEAMMEFALVSVAERCVGLKFSARFPRGSPGDAEARALFKKLAEHSISDSEAAALGAWLMYKAVELAPKHGLVVAVHCGLNWNCWNDFAGLNPMHVAPLLLKYRQTTFDLYHAGIPWVREVGVIGNQYPNACLNLCWAPSISPYMTEHVLNEWIDLVPLNKIIGFGGDAPCGPEKTYGALQLTKECIARALAVRIARGQMSESRAIDVCRQWLYDNPKRIYGL
ncbi:MAG: amidohydrolase family protein [Kiritimatiellae bacterium]|nr:amidohydrolase family protein [Kiritimatiellia bacterium]